ncbi:DUF1289 domain-containing protein [Methylomonas sp. EFPC1]|uniref:DUF1289 domain-containing protein n=2 Tax=Methylomonas TaxID=416 RepID=A0ABR9DJT2_9GAMM|nr:MULTISPECIES: DUF1289 domain-containing protein [Methylomonas]MBD9357058.1 DUF1289 domain-containing protein [Methylomonas albis]MBD9363357.1 DUF1289 domain-containing protein [Methylomonas fluvii]NOV30182.1 DUF1289 domain-containing protein [Methylomonas sp. ZR1]QBC28279.1 DUF1289 domain-containing protein [Methylomonas sp. LW13]QSA99944.1 DUF1289 domain-containing protein [Methylomonas sp. EFPC1]
MKYQPCIDQCTSEGTHCGGCGRSHQEITDTKKLVTSVVEFIREHDYENPEDFVERISKSILKKLQKTA